MMRHPAATEHVDAVAVIADIVGSRALADRATAQDAIEHAFERAEARVPALVPAWATVGDEFQSLHATWPAALRALLRVSLALPDGLELRYGLGRGDHRAVAPGRGGDATPILDGSAWHRARTALTTAAGRTRGASSAFLAADPELTAAVDGQLQLRDHVLRRLTARERRIAAALLDGAVQTDVAAAEHISQSAVSQAAARSGARILVDLDASLAVLDGSRDGATAAASDEGGRR